MFQATFFGGMFFQNAKSKNKKYFFPIMLSFSLKTIQILREKKTKGLKYEEPSLELN